MLRVAILREHISRNAEYEHEAAGLHRRFVTGSFSFSTPLRCQDSAQQLRHASWPDHRPSRPVPAVRYHTLRRHAGRHTGPLPHFGQA